MTRIVPIKDLFIDKGILYWNDKQWKMRWSGEIVKYISKTEVEFYIY